MLFPPNKIQVPNVRPFRPLLSIRAFLTKTQKSRGNRTFQPVSAGLSGVPLRAIRGAKRTRQTCPALRSLLRDSIHERWRKRRKSAGRSPRSRSVPGYSVLVESHLINCRHQALLPVCSDQTEGFADIISHFAQKCKGEFFPRRAAAGKTRQNLRRVGGRRATVTPSWTAARRGSTPAPRAARNSSEARPGRASDKKGPGQCPGPFLPLPVGLLQNFQRVRVGERRGVDLVEAAHRSPARCGRTFQAPPASCRSRSS